MLPAESSWMAVAVAPFGNKESNCTLPPKAGQAAATKTSTSPRNIGFRLSQGDFRRPGGPMLKLDLGVLLNAFKTPFYWRYFGRRVGGSPSRRPNGRTEKG